MPRIKLTKSAIDALPTPSKDTVYWDIGSPGFGVKVTPKGRKVFIVLYRTGGAGSRLRKFTIGCYGRVTLHQARVAAQKVHTARLEGRDPATEKREAKRRMVADRVEDLLEAFIAQHHSQNRSGREISRLLRREVGIAWGTRSIHEVAKRDVIELVSAIEQRGASIAANKALKAIKTFLRWCVGRAVLDQSPADGVPLPTKEVARDRVLSDDELARIILAAREMGGPYGGIIEFLVLTGQRREEAARATWDEFDLGGGSRPFTAFSWAKRHLDDISGVKAWRLHDLRRTCVSGMAGVGVPPHVADKILNHQSGTISGVAAVYQRHEFMAERKHALDIWGGHVEDILNRSRAQHASMLRAVA